MTEQGRKKLQRAAMAKPNKTVIQFERLSVFGANQAIDKLAVIPRQHQWVQTQMLQHQEFTQKAA